MKKQLLLLVMMLLPMVAMSEDVEIDGVYYILDAESNFATVTMSPNRYSGSVIIPEKVIFKGIEYNITTIGPNAFKYCSKLTSISLPKSLLTIKGYAFEGCNKIESVFLEDIAAWCAMDFDNGYYNNPLSYAEHVYVNNVELKDLNLPETVTNINKYAFNSFKGLTSVTFSNSVTTIGGNAFYACKNLNSISLSNSVKTIGNSAFSSCSGLTSLSIPNSVTTIEGSAFSGCNNISEIILGSGVESIGKWAFSSKKLTDVYCYAISVPSTKEDTFGTDYAENATLHIPSSIMDTYKKREPWKNFKRIVALTDSDPKPTGIKSIEASDNDKGTIYDLNGRRVKHPSKGLYIKNGKKYVVK